MDQNLALNVRTLIALIPFVYGLCVMYLLPKKIMLGAGFTTMMIVFFLRYLIYPILFSYESISGNLMNYFEYSVWLTLFEMIVVFILLNRFYNYKTWGVSNEVLRVDRINPLIPLLLLIYTIGVYLAFPMVFDNKHFILNANVVLNVFR